MAETEDTELRVVISNRPFGRDDEACPGCNHFLSQHTSTTGCMVDWVFPTEPGAALEDGCECSLADIVLSPSEKTFWARIDPRREQ